jgi:hypothetical protein
LQAGGHRFDPGTLHPREASCMQEFCAAATVRPTRIRIAGKRESKSVSAGPERHDAIAVRSRVRPAGRINASGRKARQLPCLPPSVSPRLEPFSPRRNLAVEARPRLRLEGDPTFAKTVVTVPAYFLAGRTDTTAAALVWVALALCLFAIWLWHHAPRKADSNIGDAALAESFPFCKRRDHRLLQRVKL